MWCFQISTKNSSQCEWNFKRPLGDAVTSGSSTPSHMTLWKPVCRSESFLLALIFQSWHLYIVRLFKFQNFLTFLDWTAGIPNGTRGHLQVKNCSPGSKIDYSESVTSPPTCKQRTMWVHFPALTITTTESSLVNTTWQSNMQRSSRHRRRLSNSISIVLCSPKVLFWILHVVYGLQV